MSTNSKKSHTSTSKPPSASNPNPSSSPYPPIANHGLIGNMHTSALCSTTGVINFHCYPNFDSPTIFGQLLDHNKGGHYSIKPADINTSVIKQQYLQSTNILITRYLSDDYSLQVSDYFHVSSDNNKEGIKSKPLLIRQAKVTRGEVVLRIECFPGFDYSRAYHTTKINEVDQPIVTFSSEELSIDLSHIIKYSDDYDNTNNKINWQIINPSSNTLNGPGVISEITLYEGQEITFILGQTQDTSTKISQALVDQLYNETFHYWQNWSNQCTYKGRWRETVLRSALTLKLMTFAPTGAIVASPTFSLPESIGGSRNWDYRYSWVRDSSFTIYAFIRLGFKYEAAQYMNYIESLFNKSNKDGSLKIMYDIHVDSNNELDEIELNHWEGYCGSSPVRIGNGAATHLQLDIYGELLDSIYLFNKFVNPISYETWLNIRKTVDYVCENWNKPDMSIWEVRNNKQNFVYSKVMCWAAVDRGLRLSEKRTLPCPRRDIWMKVRDTIYEEIMTLGWNKEKQMFSQSYESKDSLDASVLIMPLVFFISPTDPRLLSTINKILLSPDKGGLMSNNLVFRYNSDTSDDGVGGKESSFSMCTFWLVEALTRAGKYEEKYLHIANDIFEQMLSNANHLGLYSEEIGCSGLSLGNFPQAFTHIALISAAFNLDRVLK